ncbi:trypsin-like peptidase domain-containing protein [Archangium violaceum]|uniref:S1 family peptidase n=1 Tax=Archangium violaceum TaxID=83451 RepID=UPI00193BCB48|nr:serine protease [Archangium violaceum]QRK06942.1 trypsin-like peptidase domain-containing protein [Archangium violaceum]
MIRFSLGLPALFAMLSCAAAPNSQVVPESPGTGGAGSAPVVMQQVGAPTPRLSRKEQVQRILPHNVRLAVIEGGKAKRTASGVVIGNEKTAGGLVSYVLTNAHAVEMAELKDPSLVVIVDDRADSTEYGAQVVATGSVPDMDLALLKVPGLPLAPAQLAADSELELGDDVVVAASPFGRALSLSGGMLSQVEWDKESKKPRMVKTDAPIGYGASGGGIFSLETGKLLAIVEGYRTAKVGFAVAEQNYSFDVPMPGETFAAPSGKVRQFLQQKGFARLLGGTAGAGPATDGSQTASR